MVYNVSVCFTAQSQFVEAELLLKQATERGGLLPEIVSIDANENRTVFCKAILFLRDLFILYIVLPHSSADDRS